MDSDSESNYYYYCPHGQFKEIIDYIDAKTTQHYSDPYVSNEKIAEYKEKYSIDTLSTGIKQFKMKLSSLWNERCLVSADYDDAREQYSKFCSHIYESIKMLEQKDQTDDLTDFKRVLLSRLTKFHEQLNLGFLKQRFDEIECELLTIKSLIGEVTELFPSSSCNICLERQVSYFIDPCGHTLCEICKCRCRKCPMCRSDITDFKKLYF